MVIRRLHPLGLLAVLMALLAQLALGATVPDGDMAQDSNEAGFICQSFVWDDTTQVAGVKDAGEPTTPAPHDPDDCPICAQCLVMHLPGVVLLPVIAILPPPSVVVVQRTELPPPSTAPPAPHRPPSQPRAPPVLS
jgi:hypothetical protein